MILAACVVIVNKNMLLCLKLIMEGNVVSLFELLTELEIEFQMLEHAAVYTVEESHALKIFEKLDGAACKNLFLKSKRGDFFLLTLPAEKRADLKFVAKSLNLPRLSFASEEELEKFLGLHTGAVTPLGIINDDTKKVRLIIDAELKDKKLLLHPNRNTATISLAFEDLIKIIQHTAHEFLIVD